MPSKIAPPLGILMLDTKFERPAGDVGHASSWPFEVRYRIVKNASPRQIVAGDDAALLGDFVAAGEELVRDGVIGLITSCGFLAARQRDFARQLSVPVATSSLLQLAQIERLLPKGRRAGVITYDGEALTEKHFLAVGSDPATPVAGLPRTGRLHGLIERGEPYDREGVRREVLEAVQRLRDRHEGIGAIVLECTNLPPFALDIAMVHALPVYDVFTLGRWFYSGLVQTNYQRTEGRPDGL